MWFVIFALLMYHTNSYNTKSITLTSNPKYIKTNELCKFIIDENNTYVISHDHSVSFETNITSEIHAINANCDLVLFGYPDDNKVIMWHPHQGITKTIVPDSNVYVDRFGFSLDVQNQTWVVGAPGRPNNIYGKNATPGYAFIYEGSDLHSCRSLYDTYCFPVESTCLLGFKSMKDFYNLTDALVPPFQKQCRTSGTPNYITGPLDQPYQPYLQFGFDVVLTGTLSEVASGLFISAPGDTNRFMEDNQGQNEGQVFSYRSVIWQPQPATEQKITWWEMSMTSPLKAPNLPGNTYSAFGRSIAASQKHLVISTYPLYDETKEPFVHIYDCANQHCEPSPNKGISINNLPGNVLGYLTPAELAYTDGKAYDYIPADVEGDQLGDFQNAFIGKKIYVVGSNVIIPDARYNKIYRFGVDSLSRETHSFLSAVGSSTGSEHWVHDNQGSVSSITHLYPCQPGHVGESGICQPCPLNTAQTDGWEIQCDFCPRNYSTNKTGQTACFKRSITIPQGLSLEDTIIIIVIIIIAASALYGFFIACECCQPKKRNKREFVDTIYV